MPTTILFALSLTRLFVDTNLPLVQRRDNTTMAHLPNLCPTPPHRNTAVSESRVDLPSYYHPNAQRSPTKVVRTSRACFNAETHVSTDEKHPLQKNRILLARYPPAMNYLLFFACQWLRLLSFTQNVQNWLRIDAVVSGRAGGNEGVSRWTSSSASRWRLVRAIHPLRSASPTYPWIPPYHHPPTPLIWDGFALLQYSIIWVPRHSCWAYW